MVQLSKIKYVLICMLIIIFSFANNIYAVTVTDESLNSSLKKVMTSTGDDPYNCQFTANNKVLKITSGGKSSSVTYDLTNNPTFKVETTIKQGMDYLDFLLGSPGMINYIYMAVADTQGADIMLAGQNISLDVLGEVYGGEFSSDKQITVIDDTKMEVADGFSVDFKEDEKTILASKFGDRAIEYVNSIYKKDKYVISDSSKGYNTYEFTIEKKDVTDTSLKLVSTLTVKLDGDFSKMKQGNNNSGNNQITENTEEKKEETTIKDTISNDKDKTKEEDISNKVVTVYEDKTVDNSTTSTKKLPKTGISIAIYFAILINIIFIIFFKKKVQKYRGIK